MAILKRILSRVKKEQRRDYLDPCWIWQGSIAKNGYGRIRWRPTGEKSQQIYAHRHVYGLLVEKIHSGLHVCHLCDQPACCNPSHLYMGTHQENMRDSVNKGRNAKGMDYGRSPLRGSDIQVIRLAKKSGTSNRELAKAYGVSYRAITDIVAGRTWRHVPLE